MTGPDIPHQRLLNQRILLSTVHAPADLVGWLGAVQAQDYLGALWAVGLRLDSASEASVETALANRTIVRSWPLRGTLHFTAATDLRWMLALTSQHTVAGVARRFRQLELNEEIFSRSRDVLIRTLQDGKALPRDAVYQALNAVKISTEGQRGIHILWRLALDGLICYGARQEKQHTFVLLDEWLPASKTLPHEQALAELAVRYLRGHGPAMVQDFTWWSSLPAAEARLAIELVKPDLEEVRFKERSYWTIPFNLNSEADGSRAVLLPSFDEFLVGYTDRSAVLEPQFIKRTNAGGGILNPTILIDGLVAGTWKRALKKESVVITLSPFRPLDEGEWNGITLAAQRYAAFLGKRLVLPISLNHD